MTLFQILIHPFNLFLNFLSDLLNNNPKVLLMKFLGLFFAALSWYIAYRYEFKNWFSVAGFGLSGALSFLNAVFAYMEDKEITLTKLKDAASAAADVFKKVKNHTS